MTITSKGQGLILPRALVSPSIRWGQGKVPTPDVCEEWRELSLRSVSTGPGLQKQRRRDIWLGSHCLGGRAGLNGQLNLDFQPPPLPWPGCCRQGFSSKSAPQSVGPGRRLGLLAPAATTEGPRLQRRTHHFRAPRTETLGL